MCHLWNEVGLSRFGGCVQVPSLFDFFLPGGRLARLNERPDQESVGGEGPCGLSFWISYSSFFCDMWLLSKVCRPFLFSSWNWGTPISNLKNPEGIKKWDGELKNARARERGRQVRRSGQNNPESQSIYRLPCHGLTNPPTNAAPRIQTNGSCASVSFPPLLNCQIMITRYIFIQPSFPNLRPDLPPNLRRASAAPSFVSRPKMGGGFTYDVSRLARYFPSSPSPSPSLSLAKSIAFPPQTW